MQETAAKYDAHIYNVALGDANRMVEIKVRQEIGGSTIFDEVDTAIPIRVYSVPMRRFDDVISEIQRPALVKIDVQGAELMILHGMKRKFDQLDAVIVETSTISTLVGAPEFKDVFRFFDQMGWVLGDILSFNRRPLDRALAQIDALFIPDNSPMRRDKRWAG